MNIEVKNINRRFKRIQALKDVSFTLHSGSVIGFVGPNGSGKSTAMRIMSGRDFPDSGDILYDGLSILDYPEKLAGKIGYMPDSLPLSKEWRVEEYLDFFARGAKLYGEQRLAKLEEVIGFTKLDTLRTRTLYELSKGMKQQLSLARILLADPEVLLLDEPAAGLDPRARTELRDIIKKLSQHGKTILISSHILSELEDICDSMIIIERGVIISSGSMRELEMTSGSNPVINLDFTHIDDTLIASIKSCSNCLNCDQRSKRQIQVEIAGGSLELDEFMISLFQKHLPLTGFARDGRTLESIFLKSTKGEVQ